MTNIIQQLTGDFVLLDLGSANSTSLFAACPGLARAATVIEVDARTAARGARGDFHRFIQLKKPVSGTSGRRIFYTREFPECSSFLEAKEELVEAYGMERYFRNKSSIELECATVPELLQEHGISRVDLFKTDLEGLDFEVLRSSAEIVQSALCVQSELRFQPIFKGEAYFHDVTSFLADHHFELVWLRPNVWKYATPNRPFVRDGRVVWADTLFFLKRTSIKELLGANAWTGYLKQVLLSYLLGLHNFSEYLFITTKSDYPPEVRRELEMLLCKSRKWPLGLVASLVNFKAGRMALGAARRFFGKGYSLSSVYRDEVIGILPPT